MKKKKRFVFFILLLVGVSIYAQAQENMSETIGTKDGLSYRIVNDVIQDKNDFLWFSTDFGLNKYNGEDFVIFNNILNDSTSISNSLATWLFEDSDGNILVGSNAGVNVLFPDQDTFSKAIFENDGSPNDLLPVKPFRTKNGNTYCLAHDNTSKNIVLFEYFGLGKFKKVSYLDYNFTFGDFSKIMPLWEDEQGIIWLTDNRSYLSVSIQDFKIDKFDFDYFNSVIDLHAMEICPVDSKGRFWMPRMSKSDDLFQFIEFPEKLNNDEFIGFFIDNKNGIWLKHNANNGWKLNYLTNEINKVDNFPTTTAKQNIYIDLNGNSWIPHDFGITKIKSNHSYFNSYFKDKLPINNNMYGRVCPYKMLEDHNGRIVFIDGFYIKHVEIKDDISGKKTSRIIKTSPIFNEWSIQLEQDHEGMFWYPQKTQLARYNSETQKQKFFNAPFEIASIAMGPNGKIWLTETPSDNCYTFDPRTEEFMLIPFKTLSLFTNAMHMEGENLWVSTQNGISRINTRTNELEDFSFINKWEEKSYSVKSIVAYKGIIWLATTQGLWRFDPQIEKLDRYSTSIGIPTNIIYSIIPLDGKLFLGTHNGLCSFNIEDQEIKNYFDINGLNHNEFNRNSALLSRDSTIYFGGLNGINSFKSEDLIKEEEKQYSRLVWIRFNKWDDSSKQNLEFSFNALQNDNILNLKYFDHSFEFDFALLNFTDPSQNSYYYKLEGQDADWHMLGNRPHVKFNNLSPGNYVLRVKAVDLFGVKAQNELSISIIIGDPWYFKWWSYLLLSLILVSIGLGIRMYELQLTKSRAEAEILRKLNEAKLKLYSNITHEFRTPLTVIKGMAEELQGFELQKDLIQRNSNVLLNLINQMLDLSKVESGTLTVNWATGNIIEFIKYIMESFQFLAVSKNIQLTYYTEIDQLLMNYDEEKLQHIISNLVSNAIKYTNENGKIVVHLKVEENSSQDVFIIRIKDDGIGISEEDLPYIFDRYYQVLDINQYNKGGSGIGLALTKELVHLLKGEINVESTQGLGSTFIVQLPIENSRIEKAALKPLISFGELGETSKKLNKFVESVLSKENFDLEDGLTEMPVILVIEDNEDVGIYLKSILRDKYILHFAKNGETGIEKALEIIPDIILSDIMMPIKDGYEVCQTIKNDIRTSHIPIILLTAKAEKSDLIKGLKTGADAYLTKPFTKEELFIRLENLVELRKTLQLKYLDRPLPAKDSKNDKEREFLKSVDQSIEEHLSDSDVSIEIFAKTLNMSRSQLFRKIKALTGKSISSYIRSYRLNKAKILLLQTDLTISEIAFEVGYSDLSYFSSTFKEEFGQSPSSIRPPS